MNNDITHYRANRKEGIEFNSHTLSYVDILNQYARPTGQYGPDKLSLKEIALALGYKTPSILTMVLKGQRYPSRSFIVKFCEFFKINKTQQELLHLLVKRERDNSKGKDIFETSKKIQKLFPDEDTDTLDVKWFRNIAGWHFTAIKNLINTPYFIEDCGIISRQLKGRVTPKQVREALDILLELDVVMRDPDGNLRVNSNSWRTPTGINSSAIRKFHKGMILEAINSLENENVDRRLISGLTFQFDNSRKEEAYSEIMQFLNDFNNKYFDENSKSLNQLNIQFFRLNKELNKTNIPSDKRMRMKEKNNSGEMIQ